MNENITIKRPKRPRDINQLAAQIVAEAVGDAEVQTIEEIEDSPFTERGRKGGLKGGKARAEKLTPEQRKAIAEKAARERWG